MFQYSKTHLLVKLGTLLAVCLLMVAVSPNLQGITLDADAQVFGIKLPVIMYHGIMKDPKQLGEYVITPAELESDLRYISDHGYTTVVIQDLLDYVVHGTELPDKPILLTFDDGYYNNYLYAYPLLKKYNMKAVISVIGIHTDRYSLIEDNNAAYSHATWNQLLEMSESGVFEVQNHSYNLHGLDGNRQGSLRVSGESVEHYQKAFLADTVKLQYLITAYLKRTPTTYVYPYGFASKESYTMVKDMGFQASLSCNSGTNIITRNPDCLFMLRRLLRPHGKGAASLLK